MEFFGLTLYGPQNYIRDCMKEQYQEPLVQKDVKYTIHKLAEDRICSNKIQRLDVDFIRVINCYIGRVNGFACGSLQKFNKMKCKGVIKPVNPPEMYRIPLTTSLEYGWWQCDPALTEKSWFNTCPRLSQPTSPNTLILNIVRKNNKYATLF